MKIRQKCINLNVHKNKLDHATLRLLSGFLMHKHMHWYIKYVTIIPSHAMGPLILLRKLILLIVIVTYVFAFLYHLYDAK